MAKIQLSIEDQAVRLFYPTPGFDATGSKYYCEHCGRAKFIHPYTAKRVCKNLACPKPLK